MTKRTRPLEHTTHRPARGGGRCAALLVLLVLAAGPAAAQDESGAAEGGAAEGAGGEAGAPAGEAPAAEGERSEDEVSEEGLSLTLEDRIKAVSRKTFLKAGRFTVVPQIAASTNDAFYQHFGVGARFSWHLVDSLALDVGGSYFPPFIGTVSLPNVDVVRRQYEAISDDATKFGHLDLGITFSPIYGKFSVLGNWIIHFDAFLSAGLGAAFDSNVYSAFGFQFPEFLPGVNPAAEVGFGGRIFVLPWMTIRADVRDYVYPQYRSNIASLQNLVMVQIGLGFYFPFNFEYQYAAAKVVEG